MDAYAPTYAGFWKRFVAYIIDSLVVGTIELIIFVPLIIFVGFGAIGMSGGGDVEPEPGMIAGLIFGPLLFAIIGAVIASWLYFALMEASALQATLGKMALSIKVTDMSGQRITFGRATGRYFGKIISNMILCIGFMMAGFTEKKQGLHDMLAGCLVVNKV
jgi:uncharacterized RDD family membrane protein YckC